MCCYDGAFLLDGEEAFIREAMAEFPASFAAVSGECIVDGVGADGEPRGRKTAVRDFAYTAVDYPSHFAQTRCVFADDQGWCRLESLARGLGIHPWTFKPTACWLFPLKVGRGRLVPPPVSHAHDPERVSDTQPGFTTFARCGRHCAEGAPWSAVLGEEREYFESAPGLPVWARSGLSVREVVERLTRGE